MRLIIVCLAGAICLQAQDPSRPRKALSSCLSDARIDTSKATVYVSFVRSGTRERQHLSETGDAVWLRLHNNTCWNLVFPAFGVASTIGEAGVFYEVRAMRGSGISDPPVGEEIGDLYSLMVLESGRGVLFSVPREHLDRGLELAIRYNYQWEGKRETSGAVGPQHWVIYGSGTLTAEQKKSAEPKAKSR